MQKFLSAFTWRQRVRELESTTTRGSERELVIARCYLAAAEILEHIERSVDPHTGSVSNLDLEQHVARKLRTMLETVEQLL